jgi:hypothetical protein
MGLIEVLSSTLERAGQYWIRTIFGKAADIVAYIENNTASLSIFIKNANPVWDGITRVMRWDGEKSYSEAITLFTPKRKEKSVIKSFGHFDSYWQGPQRFCPICGGQCVEFESESILHIPRTKRHMDIQNRKVPKSVYQYSTSDYKNEEIKGWACPACNLEFGNADICYSSSAEFIEMKRKETNKEELNIRERWLRHYNRHLSRCKIGVGKVCRINNKKKYKWLSKNQKVYDSIMKMHADDAGEMKDSITGDRVDCCEYREPSYDVDGEVYAEDGTQIAIDEGTQTDGIMPSKERTENKSKYWLDSRIAEYLKGKKLDADDDIGGCISSVFYQGYITEEEKDYYLFICGLGGKDKEEVEEEAVKKKYRIIVKTPRITKQWVEPSPKHKYVDCLNVNFLDKKYKFLIGRKCSDWLITDQSGKQHKVDEYCKSSKIMELVKFVDLNFVKPVVEEKFDF